jgi:protein SCO1/2
MMPSRWAVACSLLAWALLAGAGNTPAQDRIRIAAEPVAIPDFTLTDHEGRPASFGSLRGREALVFFGFTHCPSVCPAAMFRLRLLTESFEDAGEPAPAVVFISVDGERDTADVLKRYLAAYPASFIGLTGDPKQVRRIAAQFNAVFFKGLPSDGSGDYLVEHTSQVYLVDELGRLRATFIDAPVEAMASSARQLSARRSQLGSGS